MMEQFATIKNDAGKKYLSTWKTVDEILLSFLKKLTKYYVHCTPFLKEEKKKYFYIGFFVQGRNKYLAKY